MNHLVSHPERLSRPRWPRGLLLALLVAGCGPRAVAPPEPELIRLTAQAAPYEGATTRRLDLVADFANPTPKHLRGVFVEVTLVDGPTLTLELGDIAPLGEGHAWLPARLERPVGPDDFFGGPALAVPREDATTLPALWLVTRFEAVHAGFRVEGEDAPARLDWTEAANARLEAWNARVAEEAGGFRARAQEAVAALAPAPLPEGAPASPTTTE